MSEGGEIPFNPEMMKNFSNKDKDMLRGMGIEPEKQAPEPTPKKTPVESFLANLQEKSGRDNPQAENPSQRIFDLRDLLKVEAEEIQQLPTEKKEAHRGPSIEEFKKMEETALRLAAHEKISPNAKEQMIAYITDQFDVWKAKAGKELPANEKQFAAANERLFGEFRNLIYGAETYKDIYPQFAPEPKDVSEVITKVKAKEILAFTDVQEFLDAAESDTSRAEDSDEWKQFRDIVAEVKKFADKHKHNITSKPRNIAVSVRSGKIKVDWESIKSIKDADPTSGYYLFDASPEANIDAPLSLNRAEKNIESFALHHEAIKSAKITLDKIEKGATVTDMEKLPIFQILGQYEPNFLEQISSEKPASNGIDQEALMKVIDFVRAKSGSLEKSATEEEKAFALMN